jgi:hypothetical protein
LALLNNWAIEHLGTSLQIDFNCMMTHVYTHLRWNLEIFDTEWLDKQSPPIELNGGIWLFPEEEENLPRVAFIRRLSS